MQETKESTERRREPETTTRPCWQKPVIVSGAAFERIQLNSGCDSGIFDLCAIPCDGG